MKKQYTFTEVLINNPQDVKYHHERVFGCQSIRSNCYISEWQCLLNTLKKNLFMQCISQLLVYPYRVLKREEPDFEIVLSRGEVMLIEITRATTMKNEALKHQLSLANDDIDMAEVSNDMFTSEKPLKGEMRKNLVVKGEGLQDTGMYGWYAEKQWVSIILSAIETKRNKHYAESVDLLLIEDRSLPYSYREAIVKRFEFLTKEVEKKPAIFNLDCFPFIVSDTSGALGIIRKDNQWLCNPLLLPEDWMAK
ncbi:MAG: hypothetical protein PHY48_09275 [Candidatus Cloacimonetes bacterium]|jgi:hypothetical protein|nr:hypothetical protein [Candidatus Cloacimonadota bacterium]MDY0326194.1 hypothetical protein [Candidatus Cloacimonadaceae bacterium]